MSIRNPLSGKHTATYRGKRVRVHCRDGSVLAGRFVERTANKRLVVLVETGAGRPGTRTGRRESVEMRCVARLEVVKG